MKKLFFLFFTIGASLCIDCFAQNGPDFAFQGNVFSPIADSNASAVEINDDKGHYVTIGYNEKGEMTVSGNMPMDKSAKLFFEYVIKDNIVNPAPKCIEQKNLNVSGDNVGAVIKIQQSK